MSELELLDRADEQEVLLRLCAVVETLKSENERERVYLRALAKKGRAVGYAQMHRLSEVEA